MSAPEITDAELGAMEARANAATGGAWSTRASQSTRYDTCSDVAIASDALRRIPDVSLGLIGEVWAERTRGYPDAVQARADADFIAHARADVPRLIAALRAERERLDWILRDAFGEADGEGITDVYLPMLAVRTADGVSPATLRANIDARMQHEAIRSEATR